MQAMATPYEIAAKIAARQREERRARSAAQNAGAQKLELLLTLLDKASLWWHGGVLCDMSLRGQELAVVLRTGTVEVARWTPDGEMLVFSGTGERTADVQKAVAMTAAWLVERAPHH
jgi:hypothetical protein